MRKKLAGFVLASALVATSFTGVTASPAEAASCRGSLKVRTGWVTKSYTFTNTCRYATVTRTLRLQGGAKPGFCRAIKAGQSHTWKAPRGWNASVVPC